MSDQPHCTRCGLELEDGMHAGLIYGRLYCHDFGRYCYMYQLWDDECEAERSNVEW